MRPQPLATLLARMLAELERERAIFDLPRRSFWRGAGDLDLSVAVHGERVANPAGPAAGPHTQLAHNLVLAWLAGARVLELKTIQILDRLEIARPCIDAPNLGFNVEWSQELTLEESIEQYVAGWILIHVLERRGVIGPGPAALATMFQASVGYDLAGVRSTRVAAFLDQARDCRDVARRMLDRLPPGLRGAVEAPPPDRMVSCVTLSTFHGCPADEIEAIAEHLLERHGVHVVIKLNPTLLGFEGVDTLLRGRLGYQELRLDRDAFARDLGWEQAVAMLGRLEAAAARRGLTIGAKLTNTLVVKNHRGRLAGETIYLSGPPLHVLAVTLADRLVRATGGRIPISFSAGIDADNFADAVACGFAPVTACTDLLKPTGYRRLPRYLKALEAEMRRLQVATVDAFVVARAAEASGVQHPPRAAARQFLASYARNLPDDPRYHAAAQRGEPRREASRLSLFDCLSCNACVVACPNDAMFSLALGPEDLDAPELEVTGSGLEPRPGRFVLTRNEQWAVYGDLCNDCGNCDTFCPEHGGPQRAKPRFFGAREPFVAAAADGLLLGEGGQVSARFGGASYELSETGSGARFSDGVVEALLDGTHRLVSARVLATVPVPGHRLPLWRYHAMRLLRDAALARAAWPRAALFDR